MLQSVQSTLTCVITGVITAPISPMEKWIQMKCLFQYLYQKQNQKPKGEIALLVPEKCPYGQSILYDSTPSGRWAKRGKVRSCLVKELSIYRAQCPQKRAVVVVPQQRSQAVKVAVVGERKEMRPRSFTHQCSGVPSVDESCGWTSTHLDKAVSITTIMGSEKGADVCR